MHVLDKIKLLISEKKDIRNIAELERKLDLSNGSIGKWNKSTPSTTALIKIANYFNVSIDYLLGIEERKSYLTPFELEIIEKLRNTQAVSPPEKQKQVEKTTLEVIESISKLAECKD